MNIPSPSSTVEPRPWQTGVAPVFIGVFLWVAFFDQIGRRALPAGGLGWSILGAAAAGPPCYLLLFRTPALWGHRTGKTLSSLASGTFGLRGSGIVPGVLLGIGQVVLFAVAVGYAVDLTFQGLAMARMIDPRSLRPIAVGDSTVKPPIYLVTALFWAIATALVSLKLVRWIGFLMHFFPIFPAVMLGGVMLATMGGLRYSEPGGDIPVAAAAARGAFLMTFQWIFSFAAICGLIGVDWGAGSVSARDVRIGGWVGIGLAPAIVAALALIAVAGHQGGARERNLEEARFSRSTIRDLPTPAGSGLDAPASTFRAVLIDGFDRRIACLMLLTFGLASLAPACFASFVFGERFAAAGPGVSRLAWTMLGATTAWFLIVGGWADRTETVFDLLGAAFAPAVGAIAADARRQRGGWSGPRRGVNPAGLIAWAVGLAVGLAPKLAPIVRVDALARVQPASLWAFLAAFAVFTALSMLRIESAIDTEETSVVP